MHRLSAIEFARFQRATADEFERILWQQLRNRQRCNRKFRRQHPLGIYTADFFCAELKLVVEVDGESHFDERGKRHDARRDQWMRAQGIRVLRFLGKQVMFETENVLAAIDRALEEPNASNPEI